jgi:FkbM family methyltransferase
MTLMRKLRTALHLAREGKWGAFKHQCRLGWRARRLRAAGTQAFVHRDLGFPFICVPTWADSAEQFRSNNGDRWEFQLLRRWLEPGDVAIDAGANLGLYTFAFAERVTPGGIVVAVEAAPFVVEQLRLGAAMLQTPQVRIVHAALSNSQGTATFYVTNGAVPTAEQSLHPGPVQRAHSLAVQVPTLTLASLADEHITNRTVAAVKLDIEGAENDALAGAPSAWFDADAPLWLLEINPSALERFGSRPSDVIQRFLAGPFSCWLLPKHPLRVNVETALRPLSAEIAIDWSESLYYNFLALPLAPRFAERRTRVRALFP